MNNIIIEGNIKNITEKKKIENKKEYIILGIETSCDDSCVGIIHVNDNKTNILANLIYNQHHLHSKYGGVVPEVAARSHLTQLPIIVEEALEISKINMKNIDLIAYTGNPGLLGSLLVGINFSKGLALSYNIPAISINHIEAHLMVNFMNKNINSFPILGLVISGGHTELWRLKSIGDYEILESTIDDAIGEFFDKVGRIMGLDFPAGPNIEKLAMQSNEILNVSLPKVLSFSGLKTKFSRLFMDGIEKEKIAKTMEYVGGQLLIQTIKKHIQPGEKIIVGGGVSANNSIRNTLKENFYVEFVEKNLCTDNGVMIAYTGYLKKYIV